MHHSVNKVNDINSFNKHLKTEINTSVDTETWLKLANFIKHIATKLLNIDDKAFGIIK